MSELTLEQALILLDESRQHNAAMLDRLYESLGIDSSDGEIRFKWAMIAIEDVKRERDAALAQNAELVEKVENFKAALKVSNAQQRIAINARRESEVILSQMVRVPVSFKGIIPITVDDYDKDLKAKLESYKRMTESDWMQHLRDVKAEAGRAGFVAAYMQSGNSSQEFVEAMYGADADQYAERVKAGEK